MIQFKIIRWKNLLASGNTFTQVKLNTDSSTLIIGENGSGKSTILDALTFGLFGRPFRSINKNQLVNSINQGGTEVEIEFSIGSKEYVIKRGISKNFFTIYQDGKLLNQDASVRDYQEFLEKTILKLNYKSFTQIVILGSSSFIPFMRLKASDRRTIIEDLLDIEIFSVMNYLLKGRVAQNKDDMGAVDISLGLSRGEREHLEFLINKLKEDKSVQINKNEKDIKEHEKFLKNYKKNINDFINKNKTLSESISDQAKVREKVNTLSDYERGIEKNIMKFEDEIEFYEKNETCGVCRQNIPKNFREEMIEDFHAKMHNSGQAILKLGLDLHDQKKRIKEIDDVLDIMHGHDAEATRDQNSLEACVQYIEKVLS